MEPDETDGGAGPTVEETLETLVEMSPPNPLDVHVNVVALLAQFNGDVDSTLSFLRQLRDMFA
jgi:hypothetical protein